MYGSFNEEYESLKNYGFFVFEVVSVWSGYEGVVCIIGSN